jgi:hypothetical protein
MINLSKIKSKPLRRLAMIPTILIFFFIIVPLIIAYQSFLIFLNTIVMTIDQFIDYFYEVKLDVDKIIKAIKECWNDSYNGKI